MPSRRRSRKTSKKQRVSRRKASRRVSRRKMRGGKVCDGLSALECERYLELMRSQNPRNLAEFSKLESKRQTTASQF
jgi:hypothetical protein